MIHPKWSVQAGGISYEDDMLTTLIEKMEGKQAGERRVPVMKHGQCETEVGFYRLT